MADTLSNEHQPVSINIFKERERETESMYMCLTVCKLCEVWC